ncbi:fungal-specific transcription factor domain-containing protein [Xylariomycetidae sp. FL2044]|nr:fungal-specific transcription factor domain-containing protein [Xylariomycetidae sp. FL2044]
MATTSTKPPLTQTDGDISSSFSDPSNLILGRSPAGIGGFRDLHPLPMHAFMLWQTFLQNVNPLSKVIHAPSIQLDVIEASRNLESISKPSVALLFAIYTAAVMSMKDEDCQSSLGDSRQNLLSRYLFATQQALRSAGLMKIQGFTILQAFTLHILSARRFYDAQATWLLSGTAVRMGQLLGLHQSPAFGDMSAFDVQMRRRLWWQILLIDGRSAQLAGSQNTNQFSDAFNFPLPANLNDSDISSDMSKETPVSPRDGPTEMIFCLLRYELGMFLNSNARKLSDPSVPLPEKDQLIDDYESYMESTYLRYCDTALPLHLLSSGGARSAICKMRLMAHHPCQYPDRGVSMPQLERDMLFATSQKMVEYDVLGKSTRTLDGFSWHMDIFFQVDAFVFMLIELRNQQPGPGVDRAWTLVSDIFKYHPELVEDESNKLNVEFCNLTLRAWEARQSSLTNHGLEPAMAPPIVARLQSRRQIQGSFPAAEPAVGGLFANMSDDVDLDLDLFNMTGDGSGVVDWDHWNILLQTSAFSPQQPWDGTFSQRS